MPGSHTVSTLIRSSSFKRGGLPRGARRVGAARSARGARAATTQRYGWWGPGGWIPGPGDVSDYVMAVGSGIRHGAMVGGIHGGRRHYLDQYTQRVAARKQYNAELKAAQVRHLAARAGISKATAKEIELLKHYSPDVDVQELVYAAQQEPKVIKAMAKKAKAEAEMYEAMGPRPRAGRRSTTPIFVNPVEMPMAAVSPSGRQVMYY